jgi:hypothetical protein
MKKTDFKRINSLPGEPLRAKSDGLRKFILPEGYTLGTYIASGAYSHVANVYENSTGVNYVLKCENNEKNWTNNQIQESEVFASLYLSDFDGGAIVPHIRKAGSKYIIEDKLQRLPHMSVQLLRSMPAGARDTVAYKLAYFLNFIHFPTVEKVPLVNDFVANVGKVNPVSCAIEYPYPPELVHILSSTAAGPSVAYMDFHQDNLCADDSGHLSIMDFGATLVDDKRGDFERLGREYAKCHKFMSELAGHYIDIYRARG